VLFPRLKSRGPIEATQILSKNPQVGEFPRLKSRGPIEAIFKEDEVLDIVSIAKTVGENFAELLNKEHIIKLYEQKRNENIRKSKRIERYLFGKSGFGYRKDRETEETSYRSEEEGFDEEVRFKKQIGERFPRLLSRGPIEA